MLSTLITVAILLGATSLLILLFVMLHKKENKKKLARQKEIIYNLVYKNKLEISKEEIINKCYLAFDKINFAFLYIHFQDKTQTVHLIDLVNIKSAKVIEEYTPVYGQQKGKPVLVDKLVNKLHLEISLTGEQPKVNLPLYQYEDGMQDMQLTKSRAYYWAELINNCTDEISNKQNRRYA